MILIDKRTSECRKKIFKVKKHPETRMVNVTDGFVTAKFERRESSPFVYDLYSASAVLNYSSVES